MCAYSSIQPTLLAALALSLFVSKWLRRIAAFAAAEAAGLWEPVLFRLPILVPGSPTANFSHNNASLVSLNTSLE